MKERKHEFPAALLKRLGGLNVGRDHPRAERIIQEALALRKAVQSVANHGSAKGALRGELALVTRHAPGKRLRFKLGGVRSA